LAAVLTCELARENRERKKKKIKKEKKREGVCVCCVMFTHEGLLENRLVASVPMTMEEGVDERF
jgi:hypothetical protein